VREPTFDERGRFPHRAATRASFVATLLVAALAHAGPGDAEPRAAGTVFYVNFDGAVITGGTDDASSNTSEVAEQYAFSGSYPAYGGSAAQRASVMAAVRADWAPFDVDVVDERPADSPYAMAVIGPLDPPFAPGINGAGPVDCYDANPGSVGFVFFGPDDLAGAGSSAVQAATVSNVFAHAVGLEHVGGSGADVDIMYPNPSSPTAAFVDECFMLAPGIQCGDMHAELSGCQGADEQNSYQELLGLLGQAQSDTQAPTVAISSPEDGDEFEAPAIIDVTVAAADDVGVVEVEILLDGSPRDLLTAEPYEVSLQDIVEGEYELVAVARDAAGNETESAPVSVTVVTRPVEYDPGGGCRCDAAPAGSGWAVLALFGLIARRRRIALRRID
jgi:hypothetical protein